MTIALQDNTLEIGTIVMGLLGGLALFLFGMEQMTDALKVLAGSGMKSLLAKLTTNRLKGLFAGAFVTSVIQSSSVTTVLVVGFISAGLMTLPQSIGVIIGANVGTTVTAQIVAFKVTQYALGLIAVGFALLFVFRKQRTQHVGSLLMGLGLIFFGMHVMGEGTTPLRSYEPFIEMMQSMDNPFMAILFSALFTGLVQSSSATMGVVVVLAGQGFITLEAGIALAFGANIGTCVTAGLAAIGKPRESVQAAVVHLLFNVLGVVIWLPFIGLLAQIVQAVSPLHDELQGTARLAAETPRQVANAHTFFNVTNAFVFIWLSGAIATLVRRLVPERPTAPVLHIEPKYLDELLLETPDLALDRVRMEIGRLGECAMRMVRTSLDIVARGSQQDLDHLRKMDDDVDILHGAIVRYLGRLSMENLSAEQSDQLSGYLAVSNYFENIGDMIETNMYAAGEDRIRNSIRISDSTYDALAALHTQVVTTIEESLRAFEDDDSDLAVNVLQEKDEVNRLAANLDQHLARRLIVDAPNRLEAFRTESDIVENLKRIYYFAKRIAKLVVKNGTAQEAAPTGAVIGESEPE